MTVLLINIYTWRDEEDKRIWKPSPNGICDVEDGMTQLGGAPTLAWMGLAHPRAEAFCWLANGERISTADFLRRGILGFQIRLRLCV